jgi:hypothetical protein
MPHTVAKRYKIPAKAVQAIRSLALDYGSQGRAIQVATELLIRLPNPPKVDYDKVRSQSPVIGMTYKLTPRTIELIERLARNQYVQRGAVFVACAMVLQRKTQL